MKTLSSLSIVMAAAAVGLTTDQIIAILSAIVMIVNIIIEILKKFKESNTETEIKENVDKTEGKDWEES